MFEKVSIFCILSLYVDDILLTENESEIMSKAKLWLSENFEMKDMGEAAYILGIKISRDSKLKMLYLSQEKYIDYILARFRMKDFRPADTPITKGANMIRNNCSSENQLKPNVRFPQAIGSLMYLMFCIRPKISFSIVFVSRY